MNNPNNKDQMHPDDMRNLIIFFIVSALLYFGYNEFYAKPQQQAMMAAQEQKAKIEAVRGPVALELDVKTLDRGEVLQEDARLPFDNGEIYGSISLKGARLDDVSFHGFYETLEKKDNVVLLSPKNTKLPRYIEYGWIAEGADVKVPGAGSLWQVQGNKTLSPSTPVTLFWKNGQGLRFERTITLDENYLFTVKQTVQNNAAKPVTLYPYGLVSQRGEPKNSMKTWLLHEGPIGWIGDKLHEIDYKDMRKKPEQSLNSAGGWAGITDKYWLTSLVPPQDSGIKYRYRYTGDLEDTDNVGRYQVDFVGGAMIVAPGSDIVFESHAFAGAKKVLVLNQYRDDLNAKNFDLAVNFGWFWFLSKPFFLALHFLGQFTGNMGVAIILLTIAIRSSVFPLTNASYKSFAKMKKVSPQIMEMRKKHGDDKQALQKELIELYKREGVNPMAGCFPMLLQIPIFFALYKVLFVTIEIRHAPFFGWIQDLSAADPTSIFNLFGLIPWDPPGLLMIGVWPCLMLLVMLVQRNLNPPPQDPIQRDMARYFPFLMAFIMAKFASGLVVYWTFSALIGVIQQILIMRGQGVPIHLFGQTAEEKAMDEAVDKGPALHPLAEMAEDEVEEVLFGDEEEVPKKISPPKKKKKPQAKSKAKSKKKPKK